MHGDCEGMDGPALQNEAAHGDANDGGESSSLRHGYGCGQGPGSNGDDHEHNLSGVRWEPLTNDRKTKLSNT